MHATHTCLRSLEDANAWLKTQAVPLTAPKDDTAHAWQRRLVEAAFWHARAHLLAHAAQWGASHPTSIPDVSHEDTAVHLTLYGQASTKAFVRPSLRGQPLKPIASNQTITVDLVLPASALPLPPALGQAFDQDVLAQAIEGQCESMFWVPLNASLFEVLAQRLGPDAVWTREIVADKLKEGWPKLMDKRSSPRF